MSPWKVLKDAFSGYIAHEALTRGAAIAFYAVTSLAPYCSWWWRSLDWFSGRILFAVIWLIRCPVLLAKMGASSLKPC